jgi:type VI secretion system protein VasD
MKWLVRTLVLMMAWVLVGCMSSAKTVPSNYSLHFQSHAQVNDGAPLKVRVMLLKSDAEFMSADFYSLQNNAQAVLGTSLIREEQFFLMASQQDKTLTGKSSDEAHYIGIMAEYQSLDRKTWRISLPLPAPTETNFYKVWQWSPDELKARVVADINGLRALND